jgi:hypothetical protein
MADRGSLSVKVASEAFGLSQVAFLSMMQITGVTDDYSSTDLDRRHLSVRDCSEIFISTNYDGPLFTNLDFHWQQIFISTNCFH